MTATITDKIMVASSGTRPNPTTLTAQKSVGASLLNADDLTGWGTSTPVTFVLYKIDSNGNEVVGTRSDWKGIVSGNTITQLTLTAGTDTIYPAGSPVIAAATARWADDLTAALISSHNQNGTLKDGSVGNTTITDGSVTTSKLGSHAVTAAKIDFTTLHVGSFRAHLSATISIAATYTKVTFDALDFGDSSFDITVNKGRFTASENGYYQFNATVGCNNVGRIAVALYKNGTVYSYGSDGFTASGSGATQRGILNDYIKLNAGDYVELYAAADVSRNADITATSFSGYEVKPF